MSNELHALAIKYATDKCIFHTTFYHDLLKERRGIKRVLEFGIGAPEDIADSLSRVGMACTITGASLFMWQDYFPEAQIFALDYKPEKFVNTGRIRSFYCDQADPNSYAEAFAHIGHNFDFILEDGSHNRDHQLLAMRMLMPLLKDDGIYIMEDVGTPPHDEWTKNIPYPHEVKNFHRDDLPEGKQDTTVIVIRKQ